MAKKTKSDVGFRLRKIVTEQFAILEDQFIEQEKVKLNNGFRFGIDQAKHVIVVFANFKFEISDKPFLIIEAGCFFEIEEKKWDEFIGLEGNTLTIPKKIMAHLATLAVGTTRGILHAKTENTPFNKYFIPTINVAKMVAEDMVFDT